MMHKVAPDYIVRYVAEVVSKKGCSWMRSMDIVNTLVDLSDDYSLDEVSALRTIINKGYPSDDLRMNPDVEYFNSLLT